MGPRCTVVHKGCPSEWNPVSLCHLWQEKKTYYPDVTGLFFQECPCEPGSVPSASRVSDVAACPPFPITADPLALLSLIFLSLVVSNSCLATWCQPLVCQLLYYPTILFKGQYCKIKGFFLIFCVCCVLFIWKVLQTYYNTVLYSWLC